MMQNKKALSASDRTEQINMSPLIDMVFILLIFFIVTTVFVKEPGVDVIKPPAFMAKNLEKNSILIAVTAQDNIYYAGKDVGLGGIRSEVRRALITNADYPVIIQADQNAKSGIVVRLIDECKLAQAKRIFVSTLK